jgi:flagellar biosynthesis protein FlhF
MNVQKFIANNSRDALRQVRDVLGEDAVILSNRKVPNGVEIMALAGDDIASLVSPSADKVVENKAPLMRFDEEPAPVVTRPTVRPAVAKVAPVTQASTVNTQREMNEMMEEIRAMRSMLEVQLSEISWGAMQHRDPSRAEIMRELLSTGFSAGLSRHLIEHLPAVNSLPEGMAWVKSVLSRNISVMSNENEILEKGGVFALVGPTGVGKTTTTAKLAARCVMRHGANKLALITTDGYRIGGHEQLRIYGKILGVMVHSVKDESDLRIALEELKGKHTVLIDTVGMNQRDQMVAEQVAMLSGMGTQVKRLLCLNATSTGETLNEVVRAYQGSGLAGCIVTKVDEAATVGNVLDVVIRQKLNLYYVANGQRVPEDLHTVQRADLIERAFKLRRETNAFQLLDDELSLIVANAVRANQDATLRGVHLG